MALGWTGQLTGNPMRYLKYFQSYLSKKEISRIIVSDFVYGYSLLR
jgi:hypothetical protein